MAEIIKIPVKALQELRKNARTRSQKGDRDTWEKLLFRNDFQSWALIHRRNFKFPLHAYPDASANSGLALWGNTPALAARKARLAFNLHKGWEKALHDFLKQNIITFPEDYHEILHEKPKVVKFEKLTQLSSGPQGKLMKYDGVIGGEYFYQLKPNNLILELRSDLTKKEFDKLWWQIQHFQKSVLELKKRRERTEYPIEVLNFIKSQKDKNKTSVEVIKLLKEELGFVRSGLDTNTIDKSYKKAKELGL